MAANYRLPKCSIAADLLLLLLLANIYTCAAGDARPLLSVSSSAASVSTVMIGSCHTAADCTSAAGGVIGEEFVMMNSATNKRLLESASGNQIIYQVVGNTGPVCNAQKKYSCIGNQMNMKKNCDVYCNGRGGGGGGS